MWPRFFFFLFPLCSCLDARLKNVRCSWISWSAGKTSWSVPCRHKTSTNRDNALRPPETTEYTQHNSSTAFRLWFIIIPFFPPNGENNRSLVMKASENRKFLGTICSSKVHSTLLPPCVCFHKAVWLEITLDLNLDILPPVGILRNVHFSHPGKLNLHCVFVINQPFVEFMCLHKQTEEGKKKRERKQILQTWTSRGKRGLLEEKQKCLRTFLCDYTVPDKSRHSCSHFVFWALN